MQALILALLAGLKNESDFRRILQTITQVESDETALKNFHFNSDRTISLPIEVLEIGNETLAPINLSIEGRL